MTTSPTFTSSATRPSRSSFHRPGPAAPTGPAGRAGALLGLLLGRVRDHEARRGGLVTLVGLDHDPVLERLELEVRHLLGPSFCWVRLGARDGAISTPGS